MKDKIDVDKVASGGDFYIWIMMFSILIIITGYLAWINKDMQR